MYIIKNYKKLYNCNNLIRLFYNIKKYPFIIFINQDQLNNIILIDLKNEISKLEGKSFIMNLKYIKNLFNNESFKFMSVNTLAICLKNINDFLFIVNLLDNIIFYFSYNKILSCINTNKLFLKNNININKFIFNLLIFKLIFNIIILILYLLYILVTFINIKYCN